MLYDLSGLRKMAVMGRLHCFYLKLVWFKLHGISHGVG